MKQEVAHLESRFIARNQPSEVSTTDSLTDDQYNNGLDFSTFQVTKDSIHTQLNASIHDFQSYKDHISIKLGSADAEIRRLKKELQVSHELYTDICIGKESLAREEDASLFLERKQSTHYNTDNSNTPVLVAQESFAPKCFKSEPFLPHVNVPSNLRFSHVDHFKTDRKPDIPISRFVLSPSPSRSLSRKL